MFQDPNFRKMAETTPPAPLIERSVQLDLIGDWGQATFHRILSWLTQQFCDRAGPKSRTRIWSIYGGGANALAEVHDGQADLCIVTPAKLMPAALKGEGLFAQWGPMPHLRALGTLPQLDRLILAVDPSLGVSSYQELRHKKVPLRLTASDDDGNSFIGHVTWRLLEAHGLSASTIEQWGGRVLGFKRPHDCLAAAIDGTANAIVQEAIMLPDWNELVDKRGWIPISVERKALAELSSTSGFEDATITSLHWLSLKEPVQAIDFADFLVVVRDDMPTDVARLLTWCLVHTRKGFEGQFKHIPSERCSLTYPMQPTAMAQTSIPLHPAAKEVYQQVGASYVGLVI